VGEGESGRVEGEEKQISVQVFAKTVSSFSL
jgi:hypothetical protein